MIQLSLKEKLLQDMKDAMKEKDSIRKNTVQLIRSGVLQIEKDKQVELDDTGVFEVIVKELKKRRDALPEYEKSGRLDLIDSLNKEIAILMSYLPEQLSDNEVEQIVKDVIHEVGAASMRDMGKVMAALTPKVQGRADTRKVSEIVKQLLK